MVAVNVGDEDAVDIAHTPLQQGERPRELHPGLGNGPAGIDQSNARVVEQGVDIDRSQPVVRER